MGSVTHKNNLHFYRIMKELSLADISKLFGMKAETFSKIEKGEISPRIELAWKLADFFGVTLADLFFRAGEEPELRIIVSRGNGG